MKQDRKELAVTEQLTDRMVTIILKNRQVGATTLCAEMGDAETLYVVPTLYEERHLKSLNGKLMVNSERSLSYRGQRCKRLVFDDITQFQHPIWAIKDRLPCIVQENGDLIIIVEVEELLRQWFHLSAFHLNFLYLLRRQSHRQIRVVQEGLDF